MHLIEKFDENSIDKNALELEAYIQGALKHIFVPNISMHISLVE